MIYEIQKRIKIKIFEAIQEWAKEYDIELSTEMEHNGTQRIFDNLDGEFKEN